MATAVAGMVAAQAAPQLIRSVENLILEPQRLAAATQQMLTAQTMMSFRGALGTIGQIGVASAGSLQGIVQADAQRFLAASNERASVIHDLAPRPAPSFYH